MRLATTGAKYKVNELLFFSTKLYHSPATSKADERMS